MRHTRRTFLAWCPRRPFLHGETPCLAWLLVPYPGVLDSHSCTARRRASYLSAAKLINKLQTRSLFTFFVTLPTVPVCSANGWLSSKQRVVVRVECVFLSSLHTCDNRFVGDENLENTVVTCQSPGRSAALSGHTSSKLYRFCSQGCWHYSATAILKSRCTVWLCHRSGIACYNSKIIWHEAKNQQ